jgi:hypothetical protein
MPVIITTSYSDDLGLRPVCAKSLAVPSQPIKEAGVGACLSSHLCGKYKEDCNLGRPRHKLETLFKKIN